MNAYKINTLRKIKAHLLSGGVIAYPTEFCFGLGCDPFNYQAINKILKLKRRDKKKGLIVISSRISQLKHLVTLPDNMSELINRWPGPYTYLLPVKLRKVPRNLIGNHDKIAVRVSAHDQVKALCDFINMPLVSTSANYSGCRPAKTYRECNKLFGRKVMLISGMTGFAKRPSVIIDWVSGEILR